MLINQHKSLGEVGFTLDTTEENNSYKNTADNESTVALRMLETRSDHRAFIYCPFHENICIRNYQEGMCCSGKIVHMKCELCLKEITKYEKVKDNERDTDDIVTAKVERDLLAKKVKELEEDAKRKELAFARAEEERLAAVKAEEGKKLSRSNSDILAAVNAWCSNPAAAEAKYGHISKWP